MIIALVGFKSSGKNTAALALLPHGFHTLSFADALKDSLASIFCWDRQLLEGITDESRTWREQVDVWWAEKLGIPHFTPRWAMQNFGTEIMRKHFHNDIWIFNMERRITALGQDTSVILTDARFPNEISLGRRLKAKVVRVKRGPDPEWMEIARQANAGSAPHIAQMMLLKIHPSEFAWIGCPVDQIIENDGSISLLHDRVLSVSGFAYNI
jgi:hypothetical protein